MSRVDVARAARALSFAEPRRRAGIHAIARVLAPVVGDVLALDLARKVATTIVDLAYLGAVAPEEAAIVDAMRSHRRAWPRSAWGKVDDETIVDLAARAATAWTLATSAGDA